MKRLTALLMCVCLTLCCAAARADVNTTSYAQDEKLLLQLKTSGFEGTLSFAAEGENPGIIDAATWSMLKAYLPSLSLACTRTVRGGNESNGSESIYTLLNGEKELTHVNVLTDQNGLTYVGSPLLDDGSVTYAFEKGFDFSALLTGAADESWPSLLHVLYAVNNADAAWQEKAQTAMTPYLTGVTAWMQNYAATTTEKDVAGGYITTISYKIPAAAVLQETKQLLVDFFSDATLLSLLREVLSAQEQAAYLQPTMLLAFLQMLDNVKLEGEVTINRQYDLAGAPLYESVALPFAENFPLEKLTIVRLPSDAGESWRLSGAFRESAQGGLSAVAFDLGVENAESGVYTGNVSLTLPESENDFSVAAEGSKNTRDVSFAYNLYVAQPLDTADTLNNRFERKYEATLLIKPDEASGLSAQSVSLNASVYSKSSSKRSVTYVDGTLALTDMGNNGTLKASLSGKTVRAWAPTMLDSAAASALRVDLLDDSARAALFAQAVQHATTSLQNILLSLMGQNVPAASPEMTAAPDGSLG